MGEVYRARDTRLDRTVALKILPADLAESSERRARFEREAKAVSALNHPHICMLYDVGRQDDLDYLVLEYIEGETLAERLKRGSLSLENVLRYGTEIADALDKAHRLGIVHRDLKPANVMLTKSGAKLLDFGLAKLRGADPRPASSTLSDLVTIDKAGPEPLTGDGRLLGTFQYMAPEQLEGKEADARTDIFTFGAVLYEMATGKKAFTGTSQASVVSAIMSSEPPPISRLRPMTPPLLDRVVKKCLAKEPNERWQTAKDLTDELQWIAGAADAAATPASPIDRAPNHRRWALISTLVCLTAGVVAGLASWMLRSGATAPVQRYAVSLSSGERFVALNQPSVALSPDGNFLVYVAGRAGIRQLYLRSMNSFEAKPIPGTEGGFGPFFSPDSRSIGYFAGGKLKRVSIGDGTSVTLADVPRPWGAAWGPRDTIVFPRDWDTGLFQVAASGGTPQPITTVDRENGEAGHEYPDFLPDGNTVLLTVPKDGGVNWDDSLIAARSLDTGKQRVLIQGGTSARYVSTGHLVFIRFGALMAAPFDLKRLAVTGPPVPIIEGVQESISGIGQYSVSRQGSAAYIPGVPEGSRRTLAWVDRSGAAQPLPAAPQPYLHPRLSPDGRKVAVWASRLNCDVMVYDLARETMTRLTFSEDNHAPIWTPDGKRITYESRKPATTFRLFWKPWDGGGPEERVAEDDRKTDGISSASWSPDGRVLAYVDDYDHPRTGRDIWLLPLDGDRKPRPFLESPFNEETPIFSSDGRWLAYVSDESGRYEVYVRPYPGPGGKWQISTEGGAGPVWNRNGRELFYRNGNKMMVVEISTEGAFSAAKPKLLFETEGPATYSTFPDYDVSPDGRRFLMIRDGEQPATQVNVVLNWFEELKRKAPTN
jgi:serine/threonine-protein kinase